MLAMKCLSKTLQNLPYFWNMKTRKMANVLRIFRWNIYLIIHQPLILKSEVGTYSTYIELV